MPSHPTLHFPTLHSSSSFFSANTNNNSSSTTISSGIDMSSQVERVVLHTTKSKSSHPMMQMTLPVDDDDLLEPAALSSASEDGEDGEDGGTVLHEASGATSRFADVHVPKKRVFSAPSLNRSFSKGAEKIPSLGRSFSRGAEKRPSLNRSTSKGAEKIPALGRSSSASASTTASRIVSKMAPMLRRVVSGTPSNNQTSNDNSSNKENKSNSGNEDAPSKSPRLGHNFLDSDEEDRDSLLFMMRVPVVRRKSHIPLMSLSHE